MLGKIRQLVLLGGGGFAREVAATIKAVNALNTRWELLGFLDDRPDLHGIQISGYPVLGPLEWIIERPNVQAIACMGNPSNYLSRKKTVERLGLEDDRYATLIHPLASVGSGCVVGFGTALLAGSVLTADVALGRHVSVMPHALLTHDDSVGDFASIAGGVKLAGGARIREGAYLGFGSLIDAGVTIGAWSQIGAGSLVRNDIPAGEVWIGTPARFHRKATPDGVSHVKL